MKRRPGGEEVPVVLLEDGVATVTEAEVRLGGTPPPRRRVRELLLVLAVVAVVAGVGLLGDDGGDDVAAPPSTSTSRPSTTRPRPRPSTTRPHTRPTTTTTAAMTTTIGTGPLLPGDPTGTTLAFVDSAGAVTVADLDTGDHCRVHLPDNGVWPMFPGNGTLPIYALQTDRGAVAVDRHCGVAPMGTRRGSGWPLAVTGDRMWIVDDEGYVVREHSISEDRPTGREIDVPGFTGIFAVTLEDDLVIAAMGEMTLVDTDSERRTGLGPGHPLAARNGRVYFTACPELRCHVGAVDVATGRRTVLADLRVVPWEAGAISSDGRFLRVVVDEGAGAVVLDTESGAVVTTRDLHTTAFTSDGRWLVGVRDGRLAAVRLDGTFAELPIALPSSAVHTMTVLSGR